MREWKTFRLKELCSDIIDCVNKTAPISSNETPYKMLRTSDIREGRINLENLNCVSLETFEKWTRRGKLQVGDVILTREAPLGEVGLVRKAENYFLGQRLVLFRANSLKCDNRFLMYSLLYHDNKQAVIAKGVGSTVLHLRVPECENIEIKAPALPIQKRIADILSAYDDLIENNQKQIKLLEEAAQRLYKEWFVDLRFPGHEKTPVVDGIPKGWYKGKISDFVPTSSGGTPSRTHLEYYSEGTNLWVKTQELNDGFIFNTEEKITDEAIRNSSAKIVPQGSILMAMYGATIGRIGIAATELTCNQACCVFNLSKVKYATSYLFCWLKDNREFFISQGKGVAQPNLSQAMIKNFDILIPQLKVLTSFSQLTDTMLEMVAKLQLQNEGLIETRDRLLPKLMNGEVEV